VNEQAIIVRKPHIDFSAEIDRFYIGANPIKTHVFNALNLLFPDGERFFVRAVHDHVADIHDPDLLRDIRAFAGQEGQHAREHERFFEVLARQGYRYEDVLGHFQALARWSSRMPRALRLSLTAGAEHYTATIASLLLEGNLLEGCPIAMRKLITWHAFEEIEHKHVAYDVLITCYPRTSYPLRVLGFTITSAVISTYTLVGLRALIAQDWQSARLSPERYEAAQAELRHAGARRFRRALRWAALRYLVPGFHPSRENNLSDQKKQIDF
jgi:predicted metal-dependent hydrolase